MQFRNLRPNLAQLVKSVVQLCVEYGGQVDHAAQPGIALTNWRDNHASSTAGRTARVVLQVKAIGYLKVPFDPGIGSRCRLEGGGVNRRIKLITLKLKLLLYSKT
jgi:hypothetical protein